MCSALHQFLAYPTRMIADVTTRDLGDFVATRREKGWTFSHTHKLRLKGKPSRTIAVFTRPPRDDQQE